MTTQPNNALPSGYQLMDYRIVRKIGGGGFSVVYLAYDSKDQEVAIKEYLPVTLVTRDHNHCVVPLSESNFQSFRYGMRFFFEEGRSLARIMHPNVVRVENFFRANDTVYMVMRYERGKTLQEYIRSHRGEVKESFIRRIFAELLNGLREVHAQKLLHLDIKPSNIYIRMDGSPVLIDFGAARQSFNAEHQKLVTMYTPGFAAPEQYKQGTLQQLGPWTDIYSVGATMYTCMSGIAPLAADARLDHDKLIPAAKAWRGKYSPEMLELIDSCLQLDPLARPQSVFNLQKAIMETSDLEVRPPGLLESIRNKLYKDIF
ncbi:MAG: serine/threonine-protein kinase [Betaproteobacteria bacterium]|nr:serine/threonine-protein kinase [Betaproteobacteria bacterium]